MNDWLLAIDFGTSFSSAAIFDLNGARVLEVGGDRRVPSIVLVDEEGSIVVGSSAAHQAGVFPDRVERTPKRYVGRRVMLLGGREVRVPEAVGAVLASFLHEAQRHRGGDPPTVVVLSHPARWEHERIEGLREAANAAGIVDPVLVAEPVAAAAHYLHRGPQAQSGQVAPRPGSRVAVYDLGGGTFDTAVLEAGDDGAFHVIGEPGGDKDIGGESFDYRLFALVGHHLAAAAPEVWQQLRTSEERRWKRAAMDLMNQVRQAKETLSTETRTTIYVPEADRDVVITRAEFEELIADDIDRTVDLLEDTIEHAGFTPADLDAIYLAGGSSRIPLVAQKMGERFGAKVQTWDDPKCVVAMGAAVGTGLEGGAGGNGASGGTGPVGPAAAGAAATGAALAGTPTGTGPVPGPTGPVPAGAGPLTGAPTGPVADAATTGPVTTGPVTTGPVPSTGPVATGPVAGAATGPIAGQQAYGAVGATAPVPTTGPGTPGGPGGPPPGGSGYGGGAPAPPKKRSRGPLVAALAVLVVLAVAAGAFVLLRDDGGGGGAALADSAFDVSEVRGLPVLGNAGEASVSGGAFVDERYLLVGVTFGEDGFAVPALWESDTGDRWDEVRADFEGAENAVLAGVHPFDDGVVVVGYTFEPDDVARTDFAAWYSTDGEEFVEADLSSSPNDQQALGVIEYQGELLAYGLDGETDEETGFIQGDFALWRSSDGREWSRAEDVAGIDLPDDLDEGLPFGELAPFGDQLIAVGRTGSGDDSDPAVWLSENGEDWDLTVSSTMAGLEGPQSLEGIAEVDGRLVAVGNDDGDAAVWTSDDGTAWERVGSSSLEEDGEQRMTSVYAVEGGAVAVGNDDPAGDGDRQPAVWFSDDLEDWQRLDLGDLATDFSLLQSAPYGFSEQDTLLMVIDSDDDFASQAVWRLEVEPGAGSPDMLDADGLDELAEADEEQSQFRGFSSLEVGDCYQIPGDDEFRYEVVPCDQPHDREVIHRFEFDDGPFPGNQALFDEGDATCQADDVFQAYVGTTYAESSVFVQALVPTEEGWEAGDRAAACVAYLQDDAGNAQQAEESFEGSGR